jgi:hypothetical protein
MAAEPRLLRLYPAAWRARYGEEFAELLASRPPALRDRLDIIAGALDARLHPQVAAVPAGIAGRARDRSVAALLVVAGALLTIWAAIGLSFAGMWDGSEEATARSLLGVSYASGVAGAVLVAIALLLVASRYDSSIGAVGAVGGVLTGSGLVFASFGGGFAALALLVGGTLMLAWRLRGRLVGTVPAVVLTVTTVLVVGAFIAVAASGWSDLGPFWILVLYGPAWMLVGVDLRAPARQLAVA